MMRWPDLVGLMAGVPWAVTGAVAARLYMPERATRDLDILVRASDAERAARLLQAAGFVLAGRLAIGGSSWMAPDGTPIDVIEGEDDWVGDALEEAAGNPDEHGAPVLPMPYLVLMKLAASRVQDLADVTRMLGRAPDGELGRVRAVVRLYAPDLAEDLESLVQLGRLESQ